MAKGDYLLCMRVANMVVTHPQAVYNHCCNRCHEPVGIFPSGQGILQAHPGIEIVCDVCIGDSWKTDQIFLPSDLLKELDESVDFTKKKPQ